MALNGAREKGQIAAIEEFTTANYHAFGSNAILIWNFDQAPGKTINDLSGNNNTLESGWPRSTFTYNGSGWSASNSINDISTMYNVDADGNQILPTENFTPTNITVSAWFYFVQPLSEDTSLMDVETTNNELLFVNTDENGNVFCTGPTTGYVEFSAGLLNPGVWHNLACSYSGQTGKISVFVDGKLVNSASSQPLPDDYYSSSGPIQMISINGSHGSNAILQMEIMLM